MTKKTINEECKMKIEIDLQDLFFLFKQTTGNVVYLFQKNKIIIPFLKRDSEPTITLYD